MSPQTNHSTNRPGSPTGSDEFDAIDASSGVYWSSPAGPTQPNVGGRVSTSTGGLGFSDQVWSEANNTSDVLEPLAAVGATPAGRKAQFANEQQIQALLTGDYLFGPSTPSATQQSPGVTAFGPVLVWSPTVYFYIPDLDVEFAISIYQQQWSALPGLSGQ